MRLIRIAASLSKKDTIIRRKLRKGAHEWMGADELMRSLMVWILSARNISGSFRLVMRRVFEGGVGIARGGIVDKSIDIFAFLDSRDAGRDDGGEVGEDNILLFV